MDENKKLKWNYNNLSDSSDIPEVSTVGGIGFIVVIISGANGEAKLVSVSLSGADTVVVVVCEQTVETPVCKLTAKKLLGSVIVPTTVQESELES